MRNPRLAGLSLAALPLLALAVGCGGQPTSNTPEMNAVVTGKVVTADGEPVNEAMINFEKVGYGAWGTQLKEDGTYSLDIASGEFAVSVVPIPPPTPMNNTGEMPPIPAREEIPEKYRTSTASGVTATIAEGENTFDLTLE